MRTFMDQGKGGRCESIFSFYSFYLVRETLSHEFSSSVVHYRIFKPKKKLTTHPAFQSMTYDIMVHNPKHWTIAS